MNHQNILIGVYVCYVIIQMYVIKNYVLNWQSLVKGTNVDHMKYNLEHKEEIKKLAKKYRSKYKEEIKKKQKKYQNYLLLFLLLLFLLLFLLSLLKRTRN